MPEFIAGQRWISNTEPELGLGLVSQMQARRVVVSFPAAGEQRTYAMDNAPLSRVEYEVGETVSNHEGLEIEITDREVINGCLFYFGIDAEGNDATLAEMELNSAVRFSKPQDRLFSGQVDRNGHFELRVETLQHRINRQQSAAHGLIGGRVQLLPHQFYIADSVSSRHAPRVMLADEVGLGKTIEAGLVLHKLLLTGQINRVLIVVPDSLVHQWLVEMLRRFNLSFTILDGMRCAALEAANEGDNPFESAQLVLCSLSFLANDPERHAAALAAGWDMMVVDEAHHLGWSQEAASHAYLCIEQLAQQIKGLLLLTATPEQLGLESHFARLRLLDPDRYHDLTAFREEEAGYQRVSALVDALSHEDAADQLKDTPEVLEKLRGYLGDDSVDKLEQELDSHDPSEVISETIQALLDRHGTGRVLYRNTRDAVEGFPARHLHRYPVTLSPTYRVKMRDARPEGIMHPEVLTGTADWVGYDQRVVWLLDWLKENRDERVLVICSRSNTAKQLENHLRLYGGVRSAVFHEGMSLIERDRAAAYFADEEDHAQVLVCSEIGSEGRNFQFASHLVMFDLPLNPDLLEQRIGRLDRIGQTRPIEIHVPFFEATGQEKLLRWYHEGLNAFEQICAFGHGLYESYAEQLLAAVKGELDDTEFDRIVAETAAAANEERERLQKGRDRLLEMNSCKPELAEELLAEVELASSGSELSHYMTRVFDQFGVEHKSHGPGSYVLHPGDHMRVEAFPGLQEEGMTATYQRSLALSRDDMHFLSWDHPMVTGAMELVAEGDYGNATVCSIKLPPIPAGTLLVEAIFVVNCPAPKSLQLQRYLPSELVRVVVDGNGNDLAKLVSHKQLNGLSERVPKRTAQDLVKHAREQIQQMVSKAEDLVAERGEQLVAAASDKARAEISSEQQRLQALAAVNPAIRQDEIDSYGTLLELTESHLANGQLQLDSLRIAVTV